VRVYPSDPSSFGKEHGAGADTDVDGEFKIVGLLAGEHRIRVHQSDDEARAIEEFTALPGQTHELVLTVDPGAE